MKVRELMTANPATVRPDQTLEDAAALMQSHDCGSLPVEQHGKLVGVVTDRDIVMRALAAGQRDASVCDVMSAAPCCCGPDDDIERVEKIMAEAKVRRVPVVNDAGHTVGIVAQADLARASNGPGLVSERAVAHVLEAVSQPGGRRAH